MTDRQTSIFSSYKGEYKIWYKFLVKDENVTVTPEIRADLEKFIENVLPCFDKYDIPRLNCELLGHHLMNLYIILQELIETTLGTKICSYVVRCCNLGKEPPSDELTSEQEQVKVDTDDKIRRELTGFSRLNFLENAFDDYFEQIKKPLNSLIYYTFAIMDVLP